MRSSRTLFNHFFRYATGTKVNKLYNTFSPVVHARPAHPIRSISHFQPKTGARACNQGLLTNLFQFIKKNQTIPAALAAIKPHDAKATLLLLAIEQGNTEADIFRDPQCYLYVLHLIEKDKIPFWQGMTVYNYLIALMQFTYKQSLHIADNDIKILGEVTLDSLVKNNQLTPIGNEYIRVIRARFAEINYVIDPVDLTQFILTLPSLEQSLLSVNYPIPFDEKSDVEYIINILASNLPFVQDLNTHHTASYRIPSSSVIHYLLEKISPTPLKLMPILGQVNERTLGQLHQQGIHPIAYYSPDVRSNPHTTHTRRCGPLAMWLHDIGHAFWGSMLNANERQHLFTDYIPLLETLKDEAQQHNDHEVVAKLKKAMTNLVDFDLTDIRHYAIEADRLIEYLANMFRESPKYRFYSPDEDHLRIGECVNDRLFFLISKLSHNATLTTTQRDVWKKVVALLREDDHRKPTVMWALSKLAEYAAAGNDQNPTLERDDNINREAWLTLLQITQDSKKLWETASKNLHAELLDLVTYHNVGFFHPYLPMMTEKLAELEKCLQEREPLAFSKRK